MLAIPEEHTFGLPRDLCGASRMLSAKLRDDVKAVLIPLVNTTPAFSHTPGALRLPSSAAPKHHTVTLGKACSTARGWYGTLTGKEESLPWGGRLLLLFVSDRGVSCLRQPYHSAPKVVTDWSRIRDYLEHDEIPGLAGAAISDSPKSCTGLPQGRARNMLETACQEKGTLEEGVGQ